MRMFFYGVATGITGLLGGAELWFAANAWDYGVGAACLAFAALSTALAYVTRPQPEEFPFYEYDPHTHSTYIVKKDKGWFV